MRPPSQEDRRKPRSRIFAAALVATLLAGTGLVYAADGANSAAPTATAAAPATPLVDFRTQLGEVKKSLEGVNTKIAERAKAIETLTKPDAAHQQVEELQALIAQTLSLVADNGDIGNQGVQ